VAGEDLAWLVYTQHKQAGRTANMEYMIYDGLFFVRCALRACLRARTRCAASMLGISSSPWLDIAVRGVDDGGDDWLAKITLGSQLATGRRRRASGLTRLAFRRCGCGKVARRRPVFCATPCLPLCI